jgi:hypothetical protein
MRPKRSRAQPKGAAARQAYIGGRLDTSQTTGTGALQGPESTAQRPPSDREEVEFPIGGTNGLRHRGADGWTKASTIGTWTSVGVALLIAGGGAVWYFAKTDSALGQVQGEVKDARVDIREVRTRVDRLADESSKQGLQLERIERSVGQTQDTVRDLASRKK